MKHANQHFMPFEERKCEGYCSSGPLEITLTPSSLIPKFIRASNPILPLYAYAGCNKQGDYLSLT